MAVLVGTLEKSTTYIPSSTCPTKTTLRVLLHIKVTMSLSKKMQRPIIESWLTESKLKSQVSTNNTFSMDESGEIITLPRPNTFDVFASPNWTRVVRDGPKSISTNMSLLSDIDRKSTRLNSSHVAFSR